MFAEVCTGASTFLAGAGRSGDQRLSIRCSALKTTLLPRTKYRVLAHEPQMFGITRQGSVSSETLTVVKATFLIVFVSHHPPNRNSLVPYSCLFFFKCKEQRTFLSWEFINQTSYRYILNIFLSVLVSSSQLSKLHLQRPSLSNADLGKKTKRKKPTTTSNLTWVAVCALAPTPHSTLLEMQSCQFFGTHLNYILCCLSVVSSRRGMVLRTCL